MAMSRRSENISVNKHKLGSATDAKVKGAAEVFNIAKPVHSAVLVESRTETRPDSEILGNEASAKPIRKGFAPSTTQLEKQYLDTQRKRRAGERKTNEMNCSEARDDTRNTNKPKPWEPTVPKEFNLSTSNYGSRCTTPERSRSCCNTPGRCSSEDGSVSSSRRGRRLCNTPLTQPQGPNLRTAHRPRSVSRSRSDEPQMSPATWHLTLRGGRSASRASSRSQSRDCSPERSVRRHSRVVTPSPRNNRPRNDESCDSISSEMAGSLPGGRSCDSRASSRSRQRLSTDEIEELRIAAKREELKALRKQNERRARKAKHAEPVCNYRSLSPLTVPKEFNLSCSATSARSVLSEIGPEVAENGWVHSLRSVEPSRGRAWEPELTVPAAPFLETSVRSRSVSSSRDGSVGPRQRSTSLNRFPREQVAMERHFERIACPVWRYSGQKIKNQAEPAPSPSRQAPKDAPASIATEMEPDDALRTTDAITQEETQEADTNTREEGESAKSLQRPADIAETCPELPEDTDLDEWVKAATSKEERAQRARRVAECKQKKKGDEQVAKQKIFTGAKFGGNKTRASGRSSVPQTKSQASPTSAQS